MNVFYVSVLLLLVPPCLTFDVQVTEVQAESSTASGSAPASLHTSCGRDKGCVEDDAEFRKTCTRLNGEVDGGRCFFRSGAPVIYAEAWKICENQGGAIAQIHTSNERVATTKVLKRALSDNRFGVESPTWMALKKDPAFGNADVAPLFAQWQDSLTSFILQLKVQNTFLRKFVQMFRLRILYECHIIYGIDDYLDYPCEHKCSPMCMLTNRAQTFNLVENLCITENAIETIYDTSPQECANECSKYSWCRSFNYYDDNTCGLLTWSYKDLESTYLVQGLKSCRHYTYKP